MTRRQENSLALILALLMAMPVSAVAENTAGPESKTPIPLRSVSARFIKIDGGSLSLPSDVAVAPSGAVYVVDGGNHRIVQLDDDGDVQNSFGGEGGKPGRFSGPLGIGIDGQNRIYVADKDNNRIQIFDSNGRYLSHFITLYKGRDVKPVDVAVNADGSRLFVTSNATHNILVYSHGGKLLRHWGGEGVDKGKFRYPATIALDAAGDVYVVDVLNSRVQVFDQTGKHEVDVGAWGALPGQFVRPKGIAVDSRGNIYISDSYLEVIQVFDKSRRFSHVLAKGSRPLYFGTPAGIAVSANGRLYISEMLKNQVSSYGLE